MAQEQTVPVTEIFDDENYYGELVKNTFSPQEAADDLTEGLEALTIERIMKLVESQLNYLSKESHGEYDPDIKADVDNQLMQFKVAAKLMVETRALAIHLTAQDIKDTWGEQSFDSLNIPENIRVALKMSSVTGNKGES